MINKVIQYYSQFEFHELQPFQLQIIQLIEKDAFEAFLYIIKILNNDMYGHYILLTNTLRYEMDIKVKTKTNYDYHAHSNSSYRLECQRQDEIRYRIEPLVTLVNTVFSNLTPLQQCQFYTFYIKNSSTKESGYIKRTLNKTIKTLLKKK